MQSKTDREEAEAVGRYAVKSAVKGKTGYMVSINRVSDIPYKSAFALVELKKIANVERKFPLEWINDSGNGIKKDFVDYCMPLIGEPLPEYAVLYSS
jgi:6-phosphofructokinase